MKRTEFILDKIDAAAIDLEHLLNDGYEIVSSQILTPDDDHVFFAAMLVKEEKKYGR